MYVLDYSYHPMYMFDTIYHRAQTLLIIISSGRMVCFVFL